MSVPRYNAFISYSHSDCGTIAPHVQKAIENIGKPWYWIGKKRLNVFRDETNLSANPGLWDIIVAALQNSDYFILLASPKTSGSKWIQKEVEWWLKNKNINTILIAVVKGNISWILQEDVNDFDWEKTDCLPLSLQHQFGNEPLYIDLRTWEEYDNRNISDESGFKSQLVKIVSAIIGKPPREIDSDELKRQNSIKRFLAGIGLSLMCLVGALLFLFLNLRKKNIETQNQLARNYWDKSQRAIVENKFLEALAYTAEAVNISKDADLTTDLLIDIETKLPTISLKNIFNHNAAVNSAVFSNDGKWILTASDDSTARVWEAATGRQTGHSMRHEGRINSAAFSPDEKMILTAGSDGTSRLWDALTQKQIGQAMIHEGDVKSAVFSRNGKRILTATEYIARIWETSSGEEIATVMDESEFSSAVLHPDGKKILTIGHDYIARLWEPELNRQTGFPGKGKYPVLMAIFSPDGEKMLVSTGSSAQLYETATGKPTGSSMEPEGGLGYPVFSPDGKMIVSPGKDGAQLWDVTSGKKIGLPIHYVKGVFRIFSLDGKRVLLEAPDNTMEILDVVFGNETGRYMKHDNTIKTAVFSPDGKQVLTSSTDHSARLWEVSDKKPREPVFFPDMLLSAAVFSPDGKRILTVGWDSTARIWDTKTHMQIGPAMKHHGGINYGVFSPNGNQILTVSSDSTIRLWDLATGKQTGLTMKHKGIVTSGVYSPDGKRILTASYDSTARIWNASTLTQMGIFMKHAATVNSAVFSSDGNQILTACEDGSVTLWDAITGKQIYRFVKYEKGVNSAVFSLDGKQILTAGKDGTARLWDIATRRQVGPSMQELGPVYSAIFSPDGKRILTSSWSASVMLWEVGTGKQIGAPMTHINDVGSAVFSPDGNKIMTTTYYDARVWNMGDLDIPVDLFRLQAGVITGLDLNPVVDELFCIPRDQWYLLKKEYDIEGRKHYETCQYPENNLWRYFNPVEAGKIRQIR